MTGRNEAPFDPLDEHVAARGSRHAAHQAAHRLAGLRVDDPLELPDELLDGVESAAVTPMRSHRHSKKVEHPKGKPERTASGADKIWKLPFWKRRSAVRRRRAL